MATICLNANCLYYPQGGGHLWVYLNWAMGLRALGCRVIWMEGISRRLPMEEIPPLAARLRERLRQFGFGDDLGFYHWEGLEVPRFVTEGYLTLEDAAAQADLLLNFSYGIAGSNVAPFKRKALMDIDPGLTQVWMSRGEVKVAPHDVYFSIGETVGQPGARFSDMGLKWNYTPPCVFLDEWPLKAAAADAPFTTVTHWSAREWIVHNGESYSNNKRDGFTPYVGVPRLTPQALELAVCLHPVEEDQRQLLLTNGWRLSDPDVVAGTPDTYRQYLQQSRGEFSCVKPSCVKLQNAWISDRSICYLASGKPVIMEDTGPSRRYPDGQGIWRFRSPAEAAECLGKANEDYPRQCRLARQLAEEHFDAIKVVGSLLRRAL